VAQPPSTTRKLASLSVDEACILLYNLELGKYETGFRAVPVSGAILATMNDEGLREVGVETGVHRTALLHHVSNFTAEGVPLELLVSSP
jgi:formate-dependent phosphoribosylglycinamide formyltransferase (GAR transformylase)